MDDRVARLESEVAILADRVRDLELRLHGVQGGRAAREEGPTPAVAAGTEFDSAPVQRWLALGGRTLVVLGGAYLLRALTEKHVLSTHTGVALGLLYGAPWLILAARAGRRGAQADALWHALATALIGYPLVWEATVRFSVLRPPQSAALLGALTAAALVLSVIARLHSLAWVVTVGALGSAAGLAIATGDWNSYTLLSLSLGLETLWVGYIRNWSDVYWLAAAGGNLMLLVATGRASVSGNLQGALLLQFLTFAGYVGSSALRSIAGSRRVTAFDVVQGAAVTVLALGGSISLLHSKDGALASGVAALILGASTYAVAFGFVRRRRDASTFFCWSLLALVLTTVGTAVCLGATIASLVFAATAASLAATARHAGSLTLNVHAAVYAIAAVAASGLGGMTTFALLLPSAREWRSPDAAAAAAFVALVAVVLTPVRSGATAWTVARRLPRLALVGTLAWTSMGLAVWLVIRVMTDAGFIDSSVLATIRTAVMVATTLVVARVGRYACGREAGWLTYPLLVITGLKLLAFDLRLGRPETLFPVLALYGAALIAAPRLARRISEPSPPPGPPATDEHEIVMALTHGVTARSAAPPTRDR